MIVDKPTTIIPINKPFWFFLELLLLNTINMNHLSFRRNYQTCYMLILLDKIRGSFAIDE